MKHNIRSPRNLVVHLPINMDHASIDANTAGYAILVRYAYYAFVLSVPFEAVAVQYISTGSYAISKIFGYLLLALTLIQPRLYYGSLPRAMRFFVGYLCIYLLLGSVQSLSFSVPIVLAQTFVQLLVLFVIAFNLMLSPRVVT